MSAMRSCRGFTLVEMLVSIALVSVVSTIGVVTFSQMSDLWTESRTLTELDAVAENCFDAIREDVAEIVPPAENGDVLNGVEKRTEDRGDYWGVTLADDQLIFPARTVLTQDSAPEPSIVMFHVNREGAESLLMRSASPITDEMPVFMRTPLARGVVAFAVEFCPGDELTTWKRGWAREELPQAIRVTLVLKDPDRPWLQVARKSVFPIRIH